MHQLWKTYSLPFLKALSFASLLFITVFAAAILSITLNPGEKETTRFDGIFIQNIKQKNESRTSTIQP